MSNDYYTCNVCGKKFENFKNKKDHQSTCGIQKLSDFDGLEDTENLLDLDQDQDMKEKSTSTTNKISLKHFERMSASK